MTTPATPPAMLAATLADFTHAPLQNADEARAVTALSVMDWVAVARRGADQPVARLIHAHVAEAGAGAGAETGPQAGAATLAAGGHAPPAAAALANGTAGHALDYDDTHFAHIGHVSATVVPAALALAQVAEGGMGATDDAFLDAVLVGGEGAVRIGLWLGRGHYAAGFHQTATAGTFGAAMAACRLLRLPAAATARALGLCASTAAGLRAQFGTMAKPLHAGLAARAGVEAALWAQAGLSTDPAALDGPRGYAATHAGAADPTALEGLGHHWHMTDISLKFHACCHGTHAMIEALSALSPGPDFTALEVETHPRWMSVCNIARPETGLEVKFSYAHLAAMVAHGHDTAALEVYSDATAHDPALRALAGRVRVTARPDLPETACRLHLVTAEGTRRSGGFDLARPLDLATRRQRLACKLRALLGAGADALIASEGRDVALLARLLQGEERPATG